VLNTADYIWALLSIRFSVWLVSGYAHFFVLLCVVIVTLMQDSGCRGVDDLIWI